MLGELGFAPWQYGLAFGAPCVGGLVGSRLARRLVARFGPHPVLLVAGTLRACWSLGLAFVRPGVRRPRARHRRPARPRHLHGRVQPGLRHVPARPHRARLVARTLAAWSVTSNACVAALTALWGLLAGLTGPRTAIAAAGVLMLATPLLLPRRDRTSAPELVGSRAQ